ncbi:MAG: hypothetical protein ACREVL_03050 [Solimonas sp.]
MNIEDFCEAVAYLEARVMDVCVAASGQDEDGTTELLLHFDDPEGATAQRRFQRRFQLRCAGVKAVTVTAGEYGDVAVHASHPALEPHLGEQGALYFASAPVSVGEVFLAVHEVLSECTQGFIEPASLLNGSPAVLRGYLQGGLGLLASGPMAWMQALEARLHPLLRVNVIAGYVAKTRPLAVTVDRSWLICETVDVVEII